MKRFLAITLCLFIPFTLCGCWNRREIGNLSIVMGFAVDTAEKEKDKIEITSQIANTKGASSEENGPNVHFKNITIEGDYVFPSIRASVSKAGSKLYMAHNFVVIFGQEAAEQGILQYMDFFMRDHEMRLSTNLLVARGRGADILNVSAGFQKIPALHIKNLIDSQEQLSSGFTVTAMDFCNRVYSKKSAPLIPIIEIDDSGEEEQLRMSGTAIFDENKMIGEMDNYETRGVLWATGGVSQGVVVTSPAENEFIGMDVLHSSGGTKTEIDENGKVTMVIQANVTGTFDSERGYEDYTTEEGLKTMTSAFSREVESEIRSALEKSKELKSDVFGFSEILFKSDPQLWEKMQNEDFYDLPVRIEVTSQILTSGRLRFPIN